VRTPRFPRKLDKRLHELLDRQDSDGTLNADDQREAETLVDLANFLTLLKLKAARLGKRN
jgi:hypothetical protein